MDNTVIWEHKADSCGGNLFDAARYVDQIYAKDGWQIVAAQCTVFNTIVMMKRPKPKSK